MSRSELDWLIAACRAIGLAYSIWKYPGAGGKATFKWANTFAAFMYSGTIPSEYMENKKDG